MLPVCIGEVAEGALIPYPRVVPHEDLSTGLHATTIFLMEVEYYLALEVTAEKFLILTKCPLPYSFLLPSVPPVSQ